MATKIPYYTMYEHGEEIANETGTEFDITRHIEFVKGIKKLVADGKTNRYAKVQAHKEECLIENILAKATVDPNALNQRTGQYGDFTKMPKTLMEAQNLTLRINDEFMSLPADVRQKFNNNLDEYINSYGSEKWGKNLGIIKEAVEEIEVKKEEADNA